MHFGRGEIMGSLAIGATKIPKSLLWHRNSPGTGTEPNQPQLETNGRTDRRRGGRAGGPTGGRTGGRADGKADGRGGEEGLLATRRTNGSTGPTVAAPAGCNITRKTTHSINYTTPSGHIVMIILDKSCQFGYTGSRRVPGIDIAEKMVIIEIRDPLM